MGNSILDRLSKVRSEHVDLLSESRYFMERDTIPTNLYALNIAFGGALDAGIQSGITFIGGPSKSFKSLLGLFSVKAYLDKYKDAVCLFYDCEFGTTPQYMKSMGIDTERLLHIPIEHLEELKFDIVQRLKEIKRGDHVIIFIDSLGLLASKKEVEDAENEKSAADMTRAKQIRSMLRIITPAVNKRAIPCIIINHVYQEIGMFPKTIMGGGTAPMLAADQVFFMSRSKEKEDGQVSGYHFTIKVEKSRTVKEESKIPIVVTHTGGIERYSGLLDIGVELGFIKETKDGRSKAWSRVGLDKTKLWNEEETKTDAFWHDIINRTNFNDAVKARYKVAARSMVLSDVPEAEESEGE